MPVHVGFMVNEMSLIEAVLLLLRFYPTRTILSMRHTHALIYHQLNTRLATDSVVK